MKKRLMTVLAVILVIAMSVAGTYAFLTSQDSVTNTFTVGQISITLDEAKVDVYGDAVQGADRVDKNTYKLIPGHEYVKDPTIHFAAGSEAAYLFVKVENVLADIEAGTTIAAQIEANGWTALTDGGNVYYKAVSANTGAAAVDYAVFESFELADDADVAQYGNASIVVTAYAVQQDGFSSAAAAWGATFGKA